MGKMKKYDSYKDSGIEWIGEIPSHWKTRRLKFFAKIFNGQDHKAVNVENGKYPIYGSGGQFGTAEEYLYDQPSVLLGRKGTIDKPRYVEQPFWTVDTAYYTKVITGNNSKFFYYLCTTINFELYKYGSAIPSMTQGTLNDIVFCAPSFDEQTNIAKFLDQKTSQIDDLIAKKERLIELLGEERIAIINQAVTKGLDPTVPMKDSGIEWIGEIPEHWKLKRLKFLGDSIGGLTYSPNDVVENSSKGILVLRSSNIQNGKLSLEDNVYVDLEVSRKLILKKGDILICSRNGSKHLIGKNICIDEQMEGNTFGAFMMVFRTKYWGFLNYFFNSSLFSSQSGLFLTATINQLTSGTLNNFFIAIPNTIEEQNLIAKFIDLKTKEINSIISKTQQEIQLLKEYKTALISEVVTGKVDVRNEKLN